MLIKGEWAQTKYRAEVGYFGKELGGTSQNRSGGRFMWEWNLHNLKSKMELSRFFNNLEEDPTQSRSMSSVQKISLDWQRPQWPSLTLEYGREHQEIASNFSGLTLDASAIHTTSGKLSYRQSSWDAYFTSYYSSAQNQLGQNSDQITLGYSMGGSYRPVETFGLIPSVGMTQVFHHFHELPIKTIFANLRSSYRLTDRLAIDPGLKYTRVSDPLQDLRTESLSVNLGSSFSRKENLLTVSMFGAYTTNQDPSGFAEVQSVDLSLGIERGLKDFVRLAHRRQTISLNLKHTQHFDNDDRLAGNANTSAMFFVKLIP